MVSDSHLMNIQVAILGVIIVIGMFYVWRALHRIESKVETLSRQMMLPYEMMGSIPAPPSQVGAAPLPAIPRADVVEEMAEDAGDEDQDDELALAEEMMKSVFGGVATSGAAATFALFSPGPAPAPKSAVIIEEEPVVAAVAPVAPTAQAVRDADTESVLSVSTGLTKSKIKRMNAEELRGLCRERNLSTEGTRAVLLDRVLASL